MSSAGAAVPRYPFPQHVHHADGSLEPNHRSPAQRDGDVVNAYWDWRIRYLVQAGSEADGHPRYRVLHGSAAGVETVSEGQGYGMLITVLLAGADPNAQVLFDGLWEFALDHPSTIEPRLMDWWVPANEGADTQGDNSAFDGDADIAYALLLAEAQWGNTGRFHYGNAARQVIDALADATLGPASHLPLLGDWVNPNGSQYNQRTVRPSDFLPGHFRAFARATGDARWSAALAAIQATTSALQATASPTTGLLPDFTVPTSSLNPAPIPAPPGFLEGPHDGEYFYNAGRVPWRLATDALLFADPTSRAQARKIAEWARTATAGLPAHIAPGYRLDGSPIPPADYFTSFFAAPLAVAATLDPAGQAFLNATYDAVLGRHEGYYEDSVTLLCLLVLTRNFWDPTRAPLFSDGFEGGTTGAWGLTVP